MQRTDGTAGAGHDACGVGFVADIEARRSAHVLPLALTALERMAHRGGVDADGRSGDGAGVTTQVPHELFEPALAELGVGFVRPENLAVGLVFLPRDEAAARDAKRLLADALAARRVRMLGWRDVPVDAAVLGDAARSTMPRIAHVLAARPAGSTDDDFERALYRARRDVEREARERGVSGLYVCSLSRRTLVYKAMVRAQDLPAFYPDLRSPAYRTAFALFHNRFSTNTLPSWALTQPFRFLAHNGEINTLQGNRVWMAAREAALASRALDMAAGTSGRVLTSDASDSANLDEALQLLVMDGRDVTHGMTMLVPPAWENDRTLSPAVRAYFDYQACLQEPWDGPAFAAFTDGRVVGATLDRNGLRPARYAITADGIVMAASEAGVLDVEPGRILHRGRLGPGEIVAVDLAAGRFLDTRAVHGALAGRRPYARWLAKHRETIDVAQPQATPPPPAPLPVGALRAFGYTREEMQLVLGPMFRAGMEPLGSMGDDTPLAVLSDRPRLLYSYFKQRFAQVTNPPIDPMRESLVMSLRVQLGRQGNLLAETPEHADQVHLTSPLLRPAQVAALERLARPRWKAQRASLRFDARGGRNAFGAALVALQDEAARAVRGGATLLILDDRGVDERHAALPALLAVSAVHQRLVAEGLRLRTGIVADTGEARDDHHVAALIGFGANAVCPWLGLDVAAAGAADPEAARRLYLQTLSKGLLKILSKMGISTIRSYHGAQLFEAVGIAQDVIDTWFAGTPSAIGGIDLGAIADETLARHAQGFATAELEEGSLHRFRNGGERHAFEPAVVKALHRALRSGERLDYGAYARLVEDRGAIVVRDLLEFRRGARLPLAEVEPAAAIFPRFLTAAMSLGALSPEAHEMLAVAMNRIGARSNSGEGGEDGARHRIKQVASGRFGVTASYLVSADELQIKMAQGSKPGEGGQLPGHKVTPQIARVRHASAGVTLISPPPHHDIYSIEDLAQLVYDLKRVNPAASVGVKLVSETGVGTVAVGVAKAHADAIAIGGYDGGTGASPLGSIKNAGTPWEIGLAETQRLLVESGLRGRVRLQVEGGLRTGRDVVMAALLGADEFAFGTAALLAAGCVMARQCHLNTCPAGIATQREDLRRRFRGTADDVVGFFTAVAEEVREILALLGERRLEDVIGRTDLLEPRIPDAGKAAGVRLDRLLAPPARAGVARRGAGTRTEPPATGNRLDESVLARVPFAAASGTRVSMVLPITNADRAVGARISGALQTLRDRRQRGAVPIDVTYQGAAGQSFGAFCVEGMRLTLVGEANDYVAKGMSGGEIVVRPAAPADGHVIAGNTILYGATGGRVFLAGRVGERFAVRNSGAQAVAEGAGDHACEYMTGGAVVILGRTGRNLGAGMTGGVVYLFDAAGTAADAVNPEMVALDPEGALTEPEWAWLREGVERHVALTSSRLGARLLAQWTTSRRAFRRLAPRSAPRAVLAPWADDAAPPTEARALEA